VPVDRRFNPIELGTGRCCYAVSRSSLRNKCREHMRREVSERNLNACLFFLSVFVFAHNVIIRHQTATVEIERLGFRNA
jgi:hypothetical protein